MTKFSSGKSSRKVKGATGKSSLAAKRANGKYSRHAKRGNDKYSHEAKHADGKSSREAPPSNGKPSQELNADGLSASVQVLPLPTGLYLFSVKAASLLPLSRSPGGQLSVPAMHVGLGPGVRSDQVEFIAGPSTHGAWLFSTSDLLVTKVNGAGATMILTSVRAPGGEVLSIKVERLHDRSEAPARSAPVQAPAVPAHLNGGAASTQDQSKPVFSSAEGDLPLPVQIDTHIRARGDMTFANVPWAGRVAPGLWIESFSVQPLEHFAAQDIEYKGLTGSGFETPWLSDNKMCGTKGMATPLVGFAIRLKPNPAAAAYDCEYSGYFQSGTTVGPLRNGTPCRSSVANDTLEGIQVRLIKRSNAVLPEAARKAGARPATESKLAAVSEIAAAAKPAAAAVPAASSKHAVKESLLAPHRNARRRARAQDALEPATASRRP